MLKLVLKLVILAPLDFQRSDRQLAEIWLVLAVVKLFLANKYNASRLGKRWAANNNVNSYILEVY